MGSCLGTGTQSLSSTDQRNLWQDRQIRWDQPKSYLCARLGEFFLKIWDNIEDTKGENGLGTLVLSNLRLIWTADYDQKLNISIGLGNIAYIHFNMVDSPTFGRVRVSHMMTQLSHTRFEFTFGSRIELALALFTDLDNALRRYRATRVFRDLILRDEYLMKDNEAVIYYGEQLLYTASHCENLTSDETFMGVMFITDTRMIWNSIQTTHINVSVPFIQFRAIGTRPSTFGTALVIETTHMTGGYILGFKFSTQKTLQDVYALLTRTFSHRRHCPFFGPIDGSVQYIEDRLIVVAKSLQEKLPTEPNPFLCPPMATDTDPLSSNSISWSISTTQDDSHEENLQVDGGFQCSPSTQATADSTSSEKHFAKQTVDTAQNIISNDLTFAPTLIDSNSLLLEKKQIPGYEHQLVTTSQSHESTIVSHKRQGIDLQEMNQEWLQTNCLSPFHSKELMPKATSVEEEKNTLALFEHQQGISDISEEQETVNPGKPIDLKTLYPLPIDVLSGQATVIYSASNTVAATQAELVLALSPSCRKYRSPKCVVCMATMTEVAFDPCGHLCSCMGCAAKLKHCPICRGEVDKILRVYLQAAW